MRLSSPIESEILSTPLRVRPLTQFDASAMGVETRAPSAANAIKAGIKGRSTSGEINAPAYEVSQLFTYQSYFSSALAEQAILAQPQNQPIIPSTLSRPVQTPGYGVALLPSSEAPVAIQFDTGGQQGRSATYRLKPGQVLYPFGRPDGVGFNGQFSGFRWGLPFGWLGGGNATLIVLRTADAKVSWASDLAEIVYHRIRLTVLTVAQINALITAGAYSGPVNWPQRFPWPGAISGAGGTSLVQSGQPVLAVQPTRTSMKLNLPALVNPLTMRMYFVGADIWAQSNTGAIDLSNITFNDYAWGSFAASGANAPFNAATESDILTGQSERFACNAGALVLGTPDDAANAGLIGATVDFVRYGRL